jgi:uncharacterized protein (UPF0335 family)
MSESVAQDQIQSYFARWQRLEDEKANIGEDLKELFKEAKGQGFDAKVLRKVFRDKIADHAELAEFEALYELYSTALGTPLARARDARDPANENFGTVPITGTVS